MRPRLSLALRGVLLAGACLSGPVRAAVEITLRDGQVLTADRAWEAGGRLHYARGELTLAVPLSAVQSWREVAQARRRRAPVVLRTPSGPGAPPPGKPAPAETGEVLEALSAPRTTAVAEAARETVAAAEAAFQDQQWQLALDRYRRAKVQDPEAYIIHQRIAASALLLSRFADAQEALLQALHRFPADADLEVLLGAAYYYQGRLKEAVQTWKKAQARGAGELVDRWIAKAQRERRTEEGYTGQASAHFLLRIQEGPGGFPAGEAVLDLAERQFAHLSRLYRFRPPGKLNLIVYPTREFHQATGAPHDVGGLFDGKVRLPARGVDGITAELERVLMHEQVHAFLYHLTHGAAPRWLHEGLAQYDSGDRVRASDLRTLAQRYRNTPDLGRELRTYGECLAFTTYLVEVRQRTRLHRVLQAIREGTGIDAALDSVYHTSLTGLLDQWGQWLVEGHL